MKCNYHPRSQMVIREMTNDSWYDKDRLTRKIKVDNKNNRDER